MSVLVVALREIRERALLLLASAILGVMVLTIPWFAGNTNPADARGAGALCMFLLFVLPLAVVTGGSVAASELAQGRLGFYFSRPVSGLTIWLGKLGGAWLFVLASVVLAIGPAALAGMDHALFLGDVLMRSLTLSDMALATLMALVIAYSLGIARASRSSLLAVDAAALAVAILLALSAVARFKLAPQLMFGTIVSLLAVAVLALVVGGALATSQGRTDARRAHRLQSAVVWPSLLLASLGAEAHSRWVAAAAPTDLREVATVRAAPRGNWVAVEGLAIGRSDYPASFLLELDGPRWVRAAGLDRVAFAPDGSRAAWLELDLDARRGLQETTLQTLDLGATSPTVVRTKIGFRHATELALDQRGERVAVAAEGTLSIYDLASERLLASATTTHPGSSFRAFRNVKGLVFVRHDRVRAFGAIDLDPSRPPAAIADFDLTSRTWTSIRELGDMDLIRAIIAPLGDRCVLPLRDAAGPAVVLIDAASGATLARTPLDEPRDLRSPARASFLADGRAVVAVARNNRSLWRIEVRDSEGALLITYDLDQVGEAFGFGDEVAPGRLAIHDGHWKGGRSWILEVDSGALSGPLEGLRPLTTWRRWFGSPGETPLPGAMAARLFLDRDGGLIVLDPDSLVTRTVLAAH